MPDVAPQSQRIPCPHCQASVKAPPLPAGSKVGCPRCGQVFVLGAITSPTPPSAATSAASPKPPAPAVGRAPATQPAPRTVVSNRPPDGVVDPMQQPAQRVLQPKSKPEHTEFGINCKLCGTRLYARPEQIGQQIQCPDCHSPVDVVAPKVAAKPKTPSLEEIAEVALSDPGERPRYKPMVRPEGEDAILGLLSDPPFDVSPNRPPAAGSAGSPRTQTAEFPPIGGQPKPASRQSQASTRHAAVHPDPADEEDDFELRLSDPVDRPEYKVELPHHIAAELPDPRNEGSYGDELWGGGPDNGEPRWQKSPFLVGIFGFLVQQSTLASWIGHSVAAGGLLCLLQMAVFYSSRSDNLQLAGLLLSKMFAVLMIGWGAAFLAACLAVVQDTANGNDAVEGWPDWHIMDWFFRAFTVAAAGFVAAFPGMLVGSAILSSGGPFIAVPLPILASLVAFFPIVLTSMLLEGSVLAIVSGTVIRMIRTAADGWILFYMLTFVLGMLAVGAIALLEMQNFIASLVAGVLGVTLTLLYARLLGRLMWYSQHRLTQEEIREENRRRWAERADG